MDSFDAQVRVSAYASGGSNAWQAVFYLVLLSVFLINCVCLVYFLHVMRARGMVHDFIDPPNLFALAVNSPASGQLAGCCGSGPEGRGLRDKWYIREDENKHVYIAGSDTGASPRLPV